MKPQRVAAAADDDVGLPQRLTTLAVAAIKSNLTLIEFANKPLQACPRAIQTRTHEKPDAIESPLAQSPNSR